MICGVWRHGRVITNPMAMIHLTLRHSSKKSVTEFNNEIPRHTVQANISREELLKVATNAPHAQIKTTHRDLPPLIEMNDDLLQEMKLFDDYDKVEYLPQDRAAYQQTASSYRSHNEGPVAMPTDRTSNSATGTSIVEPIPGRLTDRDVRQILRLHYENPTEWSSETLATKFNVDGLKLRNILDHLGPPNVLKPVGPSEYPIGIWYRSPQEAALKDK